MLDKRTSFLLDKINEICSEGGYKVVETEDLITAFPPSLGADKEGIRQMMHYLAEHKYIDIKYSEEELYCISPLPEGRMYFENAKEAKGSSFRHRRDTVLFTALGAFLGAFVGSVFVWILITFLF